MYFLRAILASLLSLVCTLAVSGYVTLQTLETTVLDRNEVKTWLDKSGVYNNLLNTTLANNQTAQNELAAGGSVISSENFKTSLNQTFTPTYIKQSAEKAIDGTYNWLDGSTPSISFEINTQTQKDTFIANLSAILEPQLAQLPRCTSLTQFDASNPTCLPPGTTAKEAANELATDAANQNSIFRQPVTDQTVAKSTNNNASLTDNPAAQRVQSIVRNIGQWLIWLPIIAIVSGGLIILLSQQRLKAAKHLAGRLTFGLGLTCAAGLLVAIVGQNYSLKDLTGANHGVMTQIIEPVLHQAAPAIGYRLALVSGLLGAATFTLWIILRIIKRKQERAALLVAPSEPIIPVPAKPTQIRNKTSPETVDKDASSQQHKS